MTYVYILDVECPKFQGTILKSNMTYVYILDLECPKCWGNICFKITFKKAIFSVRIFKIPIVQECCPMVLPRTSIVPYEPTVELEYRVEYFKWKATVDRSQYDEV